MNRRFILIIMGVLIASPFILHLEDSPHENAPKVAALSSAGVLLLSIVSSGGLKSWWGKLRDLRFIAFWLVILLLFAAAPFVIVRLFGTF